MLSTSLIILFGTLTLSVCGSVASRDSQDVGAHFRVSLRMTYSYLFFLNRVEAEVCGVWWLWCVACGSWGVWQVVVVVSKWRAEFVCRVNLGEIEGRRTCFCLYQFDSLFLDWLLLYMRPWKRICLSVCSSVRLNVLTICLPRGLSKSVRTCVF